MNLIIAVLITGFVMSVCGPALACDDEAHFVQPQLAPETAFQLAKDKAVEGGYKLKRFSLSSMTYDYVNHVWFVSFKESEFTGALGAHFSVQITEGNEIDVTIQRGV